MYSHSPLTCYYKATWFAAETLYFNETFIILEQIKCLFNCREKSQFTFIKLSFHSWDCHKKKTCLFVLVPGCSVSSVHVTVRFPWRGPWLPAQQAWKTRSLWRCDLKKAAQQDIKQKHVAHTFHLLLPLSIWNCNLNTPLHSYVSTGPKSALHCLVSDHMAVLPSPRLGL